MSVARRVLRTINAFAVITQRDDHPRRPFPNGFLTPDHD